MATAPAGATAGLFDGWYRGQQIPTSFDFACRGRTRSIWFHVQDGLIDLRSSRRHRGIWKPEQTGTVSSGGDVALRGTKSSSFAVGRIADGRLTAADIPDPLVAQAGRTPCTSRYEAVRE